MAMLAERSKKQKWSLNPRGSAWSDDSSKFGEKLLRKMGWSDGQGLGANKQGITEHIKVKVKNDSKGFGFKEKDHVWVEVENDFSNLLAKLSSDNESCSQDTNENAKVINQSLEEKSKNSKARMHYHKFTRGKDLSRYSSKDLECIFGMSKKTQPDSEDSNEMNKKFFSGGNMNDYFNNKRKPNNEEEKEEIKTKKRKTDEEENEGKEQEIGEEINLEEQRDKNAKKDKKRKKNNNECTNKNDQSEEIGTKQKKKKMHSTEEDDSEIITEKNSMDKNNSEVIKKNKKKKSKDKKYEVLNAKEIDGKEKDKNKNRQIADYVKEDLEDSNININKKYKNKKETINDRLEIENKEGDKKKKMKKKKKKAKKEILENQIDGSYDSSSVDDFVVDLNHTIDLSDSLVGQHETMNTDTINNVYDPKDNVYDIPKKKKNMLEDNSFDQISKTKRKSRKNVEHAENINNESLVIKNNFKAQAISTDNQKETEKSKNKNSKSKRNMENVNEFANSIDTIDKQIDSTRKVKQSKSTNEISETNIKINNFKIDLKSKIREIQEQNERINHETLEEDIKKIEDTNYVHVNEKKRNELEQLLSQENEKLSAEVDDIVKNKINNYLNQVFNRTHKASEKNVMKKERKMLYKQDKNCLEFNNVCNLNTLEGYVHY